MDRTGGKERWDGHTFSRRGAVRENEDFNLVVHRFLGLITNTIERLFHAGFAFANRPSGVDDLSGEAMLLTFNEGFEFLLIKKRGAQAENTCVL